jgi:hypothetical protein
MVKIGAKREAALSADQQASLACLQGAGFKQKMPFPFFREKEM